MSFAWPFVWLLLPLPLLWRLAAPGDGVRKTQPVAIPPRLAEAMRAAGTETGRTAWLFRLLPWLAWLLLLAALSQPSITTGSEIRTASGRAIVLAIDLSGSMERNDFILDGEKVDRLTAVKQVASDFVERREGDRVGLVLFGDEAFFANPLTFDTRALSNSIQEAGIGMAGRTTAIGDALGLATRKLMDDPAQEKAVILLSDGTNNSGSSEPEDAARLAGDLGVRVHSIGLGSEDEVSPAGQMSPSADLDEKTLRDVAEMAGGSFFRARTTEDLAAIYAQIDKLERAETEAPPIAQKRDLRNFFVLALILAMLAFSALDLARRTA